ncbi:MAG: endonuclease III domain-containing protein, partial [Burkholderiaceae bacterium]
MDRIIDSGTAPLFEGGTAAPAADLPAKAVQVHERLCAEYGCPVRYFHALDPVSELVSSLLSHRTHNADSALAYRQLRERFPDWEAVRDAPTAAVQEAIAPCTWPEQKAPRLQAVLRALGERCGTDFDPHAGTHCSLLSLDFLGGWPVEQARRWLEELPGVGPKTSAAVLSFSTLRGRALPVDSHHFRVAARLGLIPPTLAVGPSHRVLEAQLPAGWDAQQVYDNHQVMMKHGKRVCTHRSPACERCVLL